MAAGRSQARRPAPTLSLKGRALRWLAQREHSRSELRRKLMQAALAEVKAAAVAAAAAQPDDEIQDASDVRATQAERVDAVLDWLEANRYLSAERFAESRVNARAPRFGNLRIRQELKQHQVALSPEAAQALRESEFDRARAVLERKFGPSTPSDASARARQMRFLTARGFSPEVVSRLLRRNGAEQHATFDG